MNEFQKRFKNFDNRKLLRILEEANKYHPDALKAAKAELEKRNVSEAEVKSVKDQFSDKASKIEKRKQQVEKFETKASSMGNEFLDTVNPIQTTAPTVDRKINLIVIGFGLLAAYQIFSEFGLLRYSLFDSDLGWDASVFFYMVPILVLPIAVLLFGLRLKIGWILLCAYFVYNTVSAIGSYFVFTFISPFEIVLPVLFYGAALWTIYGDDVRDVFQLKSTTVLITVGVSMWISIILMAFMK